MVSEIKYHRRPFAAVPSVEAYFPAESIETARKTIARCLNREEGIAIVFGEAGLGKTLLLRLLAEDFGRNDLVVLSQARLKTPRELYQRILLACHQVWCGCDENETRLFTLDYLRVNTEQRVIILLDEAQTVAASVLEELRVLLDQSDRDKARVCVAMAGTSRLEERLTLPRLAPFSQRIVSRVWLDAFTSAETGSYIDHELQYAGEPLVRLQFEQDAKRQIHQYADGVPRVVNQICDCVVNSFFATTHDAATGNNATGAAATDETVDQSEFFSIRRSDVVRAWSELQQVPMESAECAPAAAGHDVFPSDNNVKPSPAAGNVVEFGSLDDEDDENDEKPNVSEAVGAQTENAPDIPNEPVKDDENNDDANKDDENAGNASAGNASMVLDGDEPIQDEPIQDEPIQDEPNADLTFDELIRRKMLGDAPDLSTTDHRNDRGDRIDYASYTNCANRDHCEQMDEDDDTLMNSVELDANHVSIETRIPEETVGRDECEQRFDPSHSSGQDILQAADEYLDKWNAQTGDTELEAQVVRQIRDIHLFLRESHPQREKGAKTSGNPLAGLDFSRQAKPEPSRADRLISQIMAEAPEKADPPENHFRTIFQQAYTKEKDQ